MRLRVPLFVQRVLDRAELVLGIVFAQFDSRLLQVSFDFPNLALQVDQLVDAGIFPLQRDQRIAGLFQRYPFGIELFIFVGLVRFVDLN